MLGRFPGHKTRTVTLPRIRDRNASKSWASITTDSGSITADDEEQSLTIVGSGGIVVSAVEGVPDTITISAAALAWKEDEYTPTDSQISFSLSETPTDETSVFFLINGVVYDDVDDYTVSGQTVTWTNAEFTIETDDEVIIRYI